MQKPSQNPFEGVEFYLNHCPHCQAWIWMESDEQACAKCGKWVYRRTLPYETRRILCRADQLEVVEEAWDIYRGRDPELGRRRREREQQVEAARQDQRRFMNLLAECRNLREARQAQQPASALSLGPDSQDLAWRGLDKAARHRGALLRLDLLEHDSLTGVPDKAMLLELPGYFCLALQVAQEHPALKSMALDCLLRSLDAVERQHLAMLFPRLKLAPGQDPYPLLTRQQAALLMRGVTRRHFSDLAAWRRQALDTLAEGDQGLDAERAQACREQGQRRLESLLKLLPAEEPEAPAEPSPAKPAPSAPLEEDEQGEGQSLKELYRRVVKLCHPDLAQDPAEKGRRNRLTALATLARDRNNIAILRRLLQELGEPRPE
jgi:hypothetical protein